MEQRRLQPWATRPPGGSLEVPGVDTAVREALRAVETPAGLRGRIRDALRRGVRDRTADARDLWGPKRE